MKKPSINQIKSAMNREGMTFFSLPYDVTLGAIRTRDNASNEFNDWLFAHYYDNENVSHYEIVEGTTDAGLYYRLNPLSELGTAVIQHGIQHRGAYELQNPKIDGKRGHRKQKAFRQVKAMKYWRDNNRNGIIEYGGDEQTGIFATNGHYMGLLGTLVGKWSAGCWGSTIENMKKLYAIAEKQINNRKVNSFSFALLHEDMF